MSSSERSAHPSAAQMQALIDYLERNPSLAEGYLKTQSARERARLQWEQLALRLNSIGGAAKSAKQWTKYWSDKKSAVKKKAAARAAARRRTGGGAEDVLELSEVEERIIALFGGEGFYTGDAHLGIQPFREPSQLTTQEEMQETGTSEVSMIPQQRSPASQDIIHGIVQEPEQSDDDSQEPSRRILARRLLVGEEERETHQSSVQNEPEQPDEHERVSGRTAARRLFASSEESAGTSQSSTSSVLPLVRRKRPASSLNPSRPYVPILSPPPPTLSRTPTPLSLPRSPTHSRKDPPASVPSASPSRSGVTSQVRKRPASSLNPSQPNLPILSPPPPTLSRTPTPLSLPRSPTHSRMNLPASVPSASPSRSGVTSQVRRTQTRRGRTPQGAGSTSRHSATPISPPSQRRREFSRITERFLRVEEQQLELNRSNSRMLEIIFQQSAERERSLVEAVTALGESLKALAEAIKRD